MNRVERIDKFLSDHSDRITAAFLGLACSVVGGAIVGLLVAIWRNPEKPPFQQCIGGGVVSAAITTCIFWAVYVRAIVLDYLDETRKPPSTPEV